MNRPELPGLREWTLGNRHEPSVRIGVILDEDARPTVWLQLAGVAYCAEGLSQGVTTLQPHTQLEASHAGRDLLIRIDGSSPLRVRSLDLWPHEPIPLAPTVGVLLRDVPAGRGFHWYRHIDQTLPGQIRLLPGSRGIVVVNELPVEDYLAGVITAEMSRRCPVQFLKAQAVVARSWLLACTEPKHLDQPFDRCNDDCCQRYQGSGDLDPSALSAIRDTRGQVLLDPAGNILDANYCKSCGGITETPWAVWGLDKPGIRPVLDAPPDAPERRFFPVTDANLDEYLDGAWLSHAGFYCGPKYVPPGELSQYLGRVDTAGDYFRWTVHYRRQELEDLLRQRMADAGDLAELRAMRVRARGASGRAYALEIEWTDRRGLLVRRRLDSEYRIRYVLHPQFLFSSAFAIRTRHGDTGKLTAVTLRGAGWGHGVGMCQIGALGMALAGHDWRQICAHYYPAATWHTAYC